jgi:hypothetical protein
MRHANACCASHKSWGIGTSHSAKAALTPDRTVVLLIPLQDLEDDEFWMGG